MQLLRFVVHVHHEHVSKQDVLHEIIPVKLFPVGQYDIADLADRKPSDHIGFLGRRLCDQYILHLIFNDHLKKVTSRKHLALCHGIHKISDCHTNLRFRLKGCRDLFSLIVVKCQVGSGDLLDLF